MFRVVYKQNSRDRTLTMQLQFNQRVTKVKTRNMSAVKWVALVTCVFLSCYGILMRCSFLVLTGHKCTDDFHYKLPVQVINSGLNNIFYMINTKNCSLKRVLLFHVHSYTPDVMVV